jgi:hypothetical protein
VNLLLAGRRICCRMPNVIRDDITSTDDTSFPYVVTLNATVHLKASTGLVRCNVYRPKDGKQHWPVLVTYG